MPVISLKKKHFLTPVLKRMLTIVALAKTEDFMAQNLSSGVFFLRSVFKNAVSTIRHTILKT